MNKLPIALLLALSAPVYAAGPREIYASWGYNADGYAPTNLRIVQADVLTDIVLSDMRGHDDRGWPAVWRHAPTVPQYSVRIGAFFNDAWGTEISYEHAKFIMSQGQDVRMTGMIRGVRVDRQVRLDEEFLSYKLNNGANFLLLNAVRRLRLTGEPGQAGSFVGMVKAGLGFQIPHMENTVFGVPNDPRFGFSGPAFGIESALRWQIIGGLYVEGSFKGVCARYRGVDIADGSAEHDLRARIVTFSVGWSHHRLR